MPTIPPGVHVPYGIIGLAIRVLVLWMAFFVQGKYMQSLAIEHHLLQIKFIVNILLYSTSITMHGLCYPGVIYHDRNTGNLAY